MVMLTIATITTRNRVGKKIPRLIPVVFGALFFSTALTLSYTNLLIIHPRTWYEPQYLIPLAGIVLGNAMNGAAIAGERFVSSLKSSRLEIETHLSLGATPQQAVETYRKEAIRAGLIPTLNQMMIVGVVTLPGMITGQLLSGIDPLNAASYQILIMFMIAFANLTTTVLVTQGVARQFFNAQAQLQLVSFSTINIENTRPKSKKNHSLERISLQPIRITTWINYLLKRELCAIESSIGNLQL
jgi:putative ABC transport system permease protein